MAETKNKLIYILFYGIIVYIEYMYKGVVKMEITKDIKYIGVNDHDIDLFEGQYVVENGMAYNSYIIMDERIAVFDTVDNRFC